MRANRRTLSCEAGRPNRLKQIRASSKRDRTLSALDFHRVSAEHPAEKERSRRSERTLAVSEATLRDAIASIFGLNKDGMTALDNLKVKMESNGRITDYRPCRKVL